MLALALAAPAQATTVEVVNASGTPQAWAQLKGDFGEVLTDAYGKAEIDLYPGQSLTAERWTPSNGCGYRSIYPAPVQAQVSDPYQPLRITLPDLLRYVQPRIDSEERRLIGLINDQRAEEGRGRLPIALTLSRAADAYAGVSPGDHCEGSSPTMRAIDAGWPVDSAPRSAGENFYGGTTMAEGAFQWWMSSTPHYNQMIRSADTETFGVGRVGQTWVLMVSSTIGSAPERMALTSDYGYSRAPHSEPPDYPADPNEPESEEPRGGSPELRMSVTGQGRRLNVGLRHRKNAEGRLVVTATRRGSRKITLRRVERHADGGIYRVRRLPRAGIWRVTARFTGTAPWTSQTRTRRVRVR